ncbi:MAG: HAD family phosphatase [Saprospiraceae bacterium]|jgi:FMN phosphatase YigB (HAD superfamily)|nr:HAD family phosphatase [Saprospiraceae bacterium]
MIRNILFDFGNVLIDIDIPATERAFRTIKGLNEAAFDALTNKYNWFNNYECGEMEEESFVNAIQRCYKPVPEGNEIIKAINAMLIGMPYSRMEELTKLRKTYNLYMLSNTNQTHLRWVHQHLKRTHNVVDFEERFFNKVFYSHLIGYRKPSLDAFKYIIKDVAIKPEETLFIDDIVDNTLAAAELGFKVYHHDPNVEIFEVLPILLKSFNS